MRPTVCKIQSPDFGFVVLFSNREMPLPLVTGSCVVGDHEDLATHIASERTDLRLLDSDARGITFRAGHSFRSDAAPQARNPSALLAPVSNLPRFARAVLDGTQL